MAHDVFISYSSQDKSVADAVSTKLESRKMRCWIAPRDIPPGQPEDTSLVDALNNSRVVVLIHSASSNQSAQVLHEIGKAVEIGIPIIPLRIEDVEPSAEMREYTKSMLWLDAITPPIEQHLDRLASTLQTFLNVSEETPPAPPAAKEPPPAPKTRQHFPEWAIVLIIFSFFAILCGVGGYALWKMIPISFWQDPTRTPRPTRTPSPTETEVPQKHTPTESAVVIVPPVTRIPVVKDGWMPITFMVTNDELWETTEDGRYTAFGQQSNNAFAWTAEQFDGDLTIQFELESTESQSEGCIILYGNGRQFSFGSLIFCVESKFYQLEKHTRFHDGENFMMYAHSNINFKIKPYEVMIEIKGDTAKMYVDGELVLSTFFDPNEFERKGRIGLHKNWQGSEITFSNIQVKSPSEEDQVVLSTSEDGWDCTLDGSGNVYYIPVFSPFSSTPIQVDGKISSDEEWADAACFDFRMHYGIYAPNPSYQKIRWWIKNDNQNIMVLVRVPTELAVQGVFADYFWPEYNGTWPYSDGVFIRASGEALDSGNWDETNWYSDTDINPPGTIDVEGAVSQEEEFFWFEFSRPLNSGDPIDWAFEPGQTLGNNPYDNFLIGVLLDEGNFMRYLQLTLGEP